MYLWAADKACVQEGRGRSRPLERAGVLVVRAWVEEGGAGFRARITYTVDLASVEETMVTASTTDEVVASVRSWLEAFLAA